MEWEAQGADELQLFLRSRRSVRRFQARPVPEAILIRILETGTWAPSAHNRQPWRFVVVSTEAARERLGSGMGAAFRKVLEAEGLAPELIRTQVNRSRSRILEAPVTIILCLDPTDMDDHQDPNRAAGEMTMAVQSVALAGGTILLAAHAEGLGAVWVCAPLFTPEIVRQALRLPESWVAQGMILLGYPEKVPQPKPRRPVNQITRYV